MRFAVIVPSIGRSEKLLQCLQAIKNMPIWPSSVVVVLQGDPDSALIDQIRTRFPSVSIVTTSTFGASRARNLGASQLSADVYGFVDDDCYVVPDWLTVALRALEDQSVGLVSGTVSFPDIEPVDGKVVLATTVSREPKTFSSLRNPVGTVDRAGNMAIRSDVFHMIGGFDENLGPGSRGKSAEDTDLVYRLMRQRTVMCYVPKMEVHHDQWREMADALAVETQYAFGLGAFIAKHTRSADFYALSLLGRLMFHLGVRPLARGIVRRERPLIRTALAYLTYIPAGWMRSLVR